MRKVERKLNKAQLITIWLLIASILLTCTYFIFVAIAKRRAEKNAAGSATSPVIELKYDEALSMTGNPMAYPSVSESNINYIDINHRGTKEKFGVIRQPDNDGNFTGGFLFHYYVNGEEYDTYIPPIMGEDAEFEYSDLYAIEGGDGFGQIYYLTYLCSAIGNPLFSERIDLPEDKAQRDALLVNYGLTDDCTEVIFSYYKRDTATKQIVGEESRRIFIGGKALSGAGFYFMIDGRPCVYYTNSEYFSYAVKSFSSYIRGVLVSKGLEQDSMYEPYLTTNFTSWTATKYGSGETIFFRKEGDRYTYQLPTIVANAKYNEALASGYKSGEKTVDFNFESLAGTSSFGKLKGIFEGKTVGDYTNNPIKFTFLKELSDSTGKIINFGESATVDYEYTVTKIEAVLGTDYSEITKDKTESTDTVFKITYNYKVGGVPTEENCHAIVDITKLNLDTETADEFVGKDVGVDLTDGISFTVTYDKESNAYPQVEYKYMLKKVQAIFDDKGNLIKTIAEDSYVNISYEIIVDGAVVRTVTELIRLSDLTENSALYSLKSFLLGKGAGDYNEQISAGVEKYEFMQEFTTYEITEIKYFTVNRIIVSFSFQNASERDPYYGETFYKNNLLNEYRYYGLNSGSCEAAVKLLGGIGADSSSAAGLVGETVAIGLTLENMEKFGPKGGSGLFAHKIYFELPRMIYDASEGTSDDNDDVLSDFEWLDVIGFTLYISDATFDEDGRRVRYIGSDMYDVIAKVDAAEFDFLEYDFTEFWGRKSLVMMDITKLEQLKLEFDMTQYTGSYTFDLEFESAYSGYVNGKLQISDTQFTGSSPITHQVVKVQASGDAFSTKFTELYGTGEYHNLALLYDKTLGGGTTSYFPGTQMTLGAGYFNTAYSILQLTSYLDNLTEEEQAAGLTKKAVMSMHVKVLDQDYYYTYDFHRIDDRRVMVALYMTNANGERVYKDGNDNIKLVPPGEEAKYTVSDYYISTFAFKKLVNTYVHLLNGQEFDENIGYPVQ